uniref:(California timema) hypothetical protein n=1 Tax=Timema californicum TaxID=61474 RepID=A0A7R9J1U3_TIMCA|nr:unnamed protein product [Timema californicum]
MPLVMATSQALAVVEGTGQPKERRKDDGTDVKVEPAEHIERGENGREELRERERICFVCWYALSDWPVSSIVPTKFSEFSDQRAMASRDWSSMPCLRTFFVCGDGKCCWTRLRLLISFDFTPAPPKRGKARPMRQTFLVIRNTRRGNENFEGNVPEFVMVVWKVYPNLFPMESVMGETTEGSKEETPSCEPKSGSGTGAFPLLSLVSALLVAFSKMSCLSSDDNTEEEKMLLLAAVLKDEENFMR